MRYSVPNPVFLAGGSRPNARFGELCGFAGIQFKRNVEAGKDEPWELKDLRKTCATFYDEHMPESSIEILGHSVGGVTYRHYAHRAPLAFKAIMTMPQPTAFSALLIWSWLHGRGANDTINTGGDDDYVRGGAGNDLIDGQGAMIGSTAATATA